MTKLDLFHQSRRYPRGALIPTTPDLLLEVVAGIVAQVVIHSDGAEVLLGLHGPGQLLTPHPADSCYLNLQAHTDVQLALFSWSQAQYLPDLPAKLRARLWQQEAWAAMPLYLYRCHTCELELEELHPIGQAPEQSIRCPLCGGYFVRDLGRFHVGGRHAVAVATTPTHVIEHGVDCPCCAPRTARR